MIFPFIRLLLTYVAIGLAMGILFFYIFHRPFLGEFWGYVILGTLSAALGGLLELFTRDWWIVSWDPFRQFNLIPPLGVAFLMTLIIQGIYNARDD
ncbi:MAG: hypothetical protein SNJ78_03130 [Spirochaetales bacterium]